MDILPPLTKVLNKREAKITPRVLKWFSKNYPFSVALEIKATKTNSIPGSALKSHQKKALIAVQSEAGLSYKIPDASYLRLPFDAFQLKNTKSFVVACFLEKGICLAIPPEKWRGAKYNPMSDCSIRIDI
jgi:hypothetical protein|tara:strand:- start:2657 stop:3046 length:390 start_codon:yes stop_codon:yes gene_type:complete